MLFAHYSITDASELVKSGNGFIYDSPPSRLDLPLAPLDLANDVKTQSALAALKTAMPVKAHAHAYAPSIAVHQRKPKLKVIERVIIDVVPSVATAKQRQASLSSSSRIKVMNSRLFRYPLVAAPSNTATSLLVSRPGYEYGTPYRYYRTLF